MNPEFSSSDTILRHLDAYVNGISDDYIKSRYTGFVAVTAVTAYEVNIRAKIFEFCRKKHLVFGHFAESHFEKTNAKVKIDHLKDGYLKKFGLKYLNRFKAKTDALEEEHLRVHRKSLKGSYNNLVQWRHGFVHDGELPAYATYDDARAAYEAGKLIVSAFFCSLER